MPLDRMLDLRALDFLVAGAFSPTSQIENGIFKPQVVSHSTSTIFDKIGT